MNKLLALTLFGAVAMVAASLQSTAVAAPPASATAPAAAPAAAAPAAPAVVAAPAKAAPVAAAPAKQTPKPHKSVAQKQSALKAAGFDPGPIDGVIGKKTRAAISAFQKANNIPVTGRFNKATVAALKP